MENHQIKISCPKHISTDFSRIDDVMSERFFKRNFSKEEMDSKIVSRIKIYKDMQKKKLSLIMERIKGNKSSNFFLVKEVIHLGKMKLKNSIYSSNNSQNTAFSLYLFFY